MVINQKRKKRYCQHNREFKLTSKEFRKYAKECKDGTKKWKDSDVFKKLKTVPYGSKGNCGFGGEFYYHSYKREFIGNVINKSAERRKNKIKITDIENDE